MTALKQAIQKAGGVTKAAEACGVSPRAVYKWISAGCLPRTDYTGETQYAYLLASAAEGAFAAEWLLAAASPNKSAA